MTSEFLRSACPHDCPSCCALEVERIDARTIGKVRGNAANDYTAGVICAKVSAYKERQHHPDRLTHPMKRVGPKGTGAFERISWDEALDTVAENFKRAEAEYGPETVWPYHFAGTMGLVQRDSIFRLRHAFGFSRMEQTICTAAPDAGWKAGVGAMRGADPREIQESDLIVVWGGNPVSTQVNVMTHVAKARKARGAKLVVIDVYETPTASAADIFLKVRPGTDGALAVAILHVLFKEGLADRQYLAEYTDFPADLEAHLESRDPAWASEITGVPVEDILAFARLYGSTPKSFMRVGYGFTRSRNGPAAMHAVSCLPAATGSWRHKGGGALYTNRSIFGVDQSMVMALDRFDRSVRELDMCQIGRILARDEVALKGGPPVTAMLTQNVNPADVAPESNLVRDGLRRDDLFLCVHEQFMTETAKFADILLPATTFLECDDLYQGGGHIYLQVAKAILEPLGECRDNTAVINGIAKRLGTDHPAFSMSAWDLIDDALTRTGYPDAETLHAKGWENCVKPFEEMHFLNGFGHADGKFHFSPDWSAVGETHSDMPRLPDHMPAHDSSDKDHPFRMVTAPARRFLNTSFTEMPSSLKKERGPRAKIHPQVCAEMGLAEGDPIRVGNKRGAVTVTVEPFDELDLNTVVVESVWPGHHFPEGVGINALVSADRALPNGGGVFHDTAVWLAKP